MVTRFKEMFDIQGSLVDLLQRPVRPQQADAAESCIEQAPGLRLQGQVTAFQVGIWQGFKRGRRQGGGTGLQLENAVAGDDMQAAGVHGDGADGSSGQMVGLVENGDGFAGVHPGDPALGGDPEVFLAVEVQTVDGRAGQTRGAVNDAQNVTVGVNEGDPSAVGADGKSVAVDGTGRRNEVFPDKIPAIARQDSQL